MTAAFVLLSGGVDSTTCLYHARAHHEHVYAVGIHYKQRHKRELSYAQKTCDKLGITYSILDVGDLLYSKEILLSAASVGELSMVHKDYSEIEGVSPSYVPFRNGLLLAAITAHAQKHVNKRIDERAEDFDAELGSVGKHRATAEYRDYASIYYGAHSEDAANWAYPDCTPEFNGSMANAIYTGSYNTIRLVTPLQWLEKWQVVQLGESLGVDWALTWSCYDTGEQHCGECPTCRARRLAFNRAGVVDPTPYLVSPKS